MQHATKHDDVIETVDTGKPIKSTPAPPATVILCPRCGTPWSADYGDYAWMQNSDLIVCACGEALCEVGELKEG
ncbi:MAG: hypothetical protein ACE5LH_03730 [Fidelibacterota bacterium]